MRAIVIAAVVLMLSAGSAAAETGNGLLTECRKLEAMLARGGETAPQSEVQSIGYCQGYIDGTLDMLNNSLNTSGEVCVPANVTYDQAYAVVIKYLKETPTQLHHVAAALISTAITKAWPCKK